MKVRWQDVLSPESKVRETLALEAPDILPELIDAYSWVQVDLALVELRPDRTMLGRHDQEPVHVGRRDAFIEAIRNWQPIPPLIALGAELRLVDGYARYRALRWLGVERARVLRQRIDR